MIPFLGEIFALFAAFCYAFGSVAATKNARENNGRGNAVLLSIVMTAVFSAGLWAVIGPQAPSLDADFWIGVAWFVLAGVLATILGRFLFFRSIDLAGAIETGLIRRLIPVFATTLAILILGEVITMQIGLAFLLVFSGVAVVVFVSPHRLGPALPADAVRDAKTRMTGRGLALGSAACYGGSYTVRKFAMQYLPDPLAGAFIGAVTGMAWFAVVAPFSASYRRQIAQLFIKPAPWQVAAAASISLGQMAQFMALRHTTVTAVAIIGTIEMFFAAWLAAFVVRTEARPGIRFIIASLLAMSGVIVLALARAPT